MFLRRLVTQAAEGTVVAKDGERPSEEACTVARGILLVEGEGEEKQNYEESVQSSQGTSSMMVCREVLRVSAGKERLISGALGLI